MNGKPENVRHQRRPALELLAAAAWLTLAPPAALCETTPAAGTVDSRVRTALYSPDEVYRLEGRAGYQIDIQFDRGETFVGLGAGDLQALTFVAQGNHLFLKPKASRVSTNLTVMTTARDYRFDYSVSPKQLDGEDPPVIYALRFVYPHSENAVSAAQEESADIDGKLRSADEAKSGSTDYWYCGHPSLKPTAASDDGMRTRLRFGDRAELPAIFVRNDDGSESLVNSSIQDGDVIVHRVAHRFILRRGKLTGCVVNAGFSGSGERTRSETISPAVGRVTKGERP